MRISNPTAKKGEELACNFLQNKHYTIIERNFHGRYGEIDIIAIDPSVSKNTPTLVFVEVKTRTTNKFGTPFEAITRWKLQTVLKTAQFYIYSHRNLPDLLRIDAISVELLPNGNIKDIQHAQNISGF